MQNSAKKRNMCDLLAGIFNGDKRDGWYDHIVSMLKSQDYPELEQYILARAHDYNTIPQFLAAWERTIDGFDNFMDECVGKFYLEVVRWPERTCGDSIKEDVVERYLNALHMYTLALVIHRFLKLEDEADE